MIFYYTEEKYNKALKLVENIFHYRNDTQKAICITNVYGFTRHRLFSLAHKVDRQE